MLSFSVILGRIIFCNLCTWHSYFMYSFTRNDIVMFSEIIVLKNEEVAVYYFKARSKCLNGGNEEYRDKSH